MTALSACSNERAKTEMRTWVLSSVTCVLILTLKTSSVTRVMISTLESSSLWLVCWFWHLSPHLCDSCHDFNTWVGMSPHLCDSCHDFDTWVLISVTRVMILTLESLSLWLVSWFWHLSLMILTLESSSLRLVSWFWHLSLACQLPVLTWDLTWNLHLMAQDLLQTWHQWLTTYLLEPFASQTHTLKCWYFWPPHHVIGGHYVHKCLLRRDLWEQERLYASMLSICSFVCCRT